MQLAAESGAAKRRRAKKQLKTLASQGVISIALAKRALDALSRHNWSLSWERRSCGKSGCSTCPHGPYLFARRTVRGRRHRLYLGKG